MNINHRSVELRQHLHHLSLAYSFLCSWLLFDEEGYSGNQYILGEGLYPDLTSCGCLSTAIRSLKPIPYVSDVCYQHISFDLRNHQTADDTCHILNVFSQSFTDPSISLFSLSGFEGLEKTLFSDMENMSGFFSQSLKVNSGL